MTPEQRRQFVRDHRTAIFGYNRAKDGPAMSIVYYANAPMTRSSSRPWPNEPRRRRSQETRRCACVLDEQWPPSYLQLYCDAEIDTDFHATVDVMMRIAGVMAGAPMSEEVRPMVEEGARQETRVAVRLRPYATFYTPPRHVHGEAGINPELTHETSSSMPW